MNGTAQAHDVPSYALLAGAPAESSDWLEVCSPLTPDPDALSSLLRDVLASGRLSNGGPLSSRLEEELARRLRVTELVAVSSGTAGLELAIKAAIPPGEVITTAYSYPATWAFLLDDPRWVPVFVDIDDRLGLDPEQVTAAITPRTSGILAVHPYGMPCNHEALASVAERAGLALVYDAAAGFGVEVGGRGLADLGGLSVVSFHATKVYNTVEGGGLAGDPTLLHRVRLRRSAEGEGKATVAQNARLDEMRAAVGLLNLRIVDAAIERRGAIVQGYLARLGALRLDEIEPLLPRLRGPGVRSNHAYFPILVRSGPRLDRDGLAERLRERRIRPGPYFWKTVATDPAYDGLRRLGVLGRTEAVSRSVLCLPLHHGMTEDDCSRVVDVVAEAYGVARLEG